MYVKAFLQTVYIQSVKKLNTENLTFNKKLKLLIWI